jgi:hypothetical protein
MKKQRKHYTPEEKVATLRRHLLEKDPISKISDELGLQPTVSAGGGRSSSRMGGGIRTEEATEIILQARRRNTRKRVRGLCRTTGR